MNIDINLRKLQKPELLSPAGNLEALKIAVQAGADAVYFGWEKFGARAFAGNFSKDEIKVGIEYATLRNTKTYLTLNTLIKNRELDEVLDIALYAWNEGINAIIVQDLGVIKRLKEVAPEIILHGSTQMTIYNTDGARISKDFGLSRIVLARETPLNELTKINKSIEIETEFFIHGALCISYSGQCLMSSMIGGRSANRGKCAQPCRLPYELVQSPTNKTLKEKSYLLSPKDLWSIESLPELIKSGVTSLKIEGRMKPIEYVASVTSIYRKYIDIAYNSIIQNFEYTVSEIDKDELKQIFNRGGFTKGYADAENKEDILYIKTPKNIGLFLGNGSSKNNSIFLNTEYPIKNGDGIEIWKDYNCLYSGLIHNNILNRNGRYEISNIKIGKYVDFEVYKTSSKSLKRDLKERYHRETNKNLDIDVNIVINENGNCLIRIIRAGGIIDDFTYNLDIENANIKEITNDSFSRIFNKTGNNAFNIKNITVTIPKNIYISTSNINTMRQVILNALEIKILAENKRNIVIKENAKVQEEVIKSESSAKLSLYFYTSKDLLRIKNLSNTRVYLPLKDINTTGIIKNLYENNVEVFLYMPNILYNNEFTESYLNNENMNYIHGISIGNLSQIELLKKHSILKKLSGSFELNIMNSESINLLSDYNLSTITISPELNHNETLHMQSNTPISKELIVYGYLPIMTLETYGNRNLGEIYLKDRKNMNFRLLTEDYNANAKVFNSEKIIIESDFDKYVEAGYKYFRLNILDESENDIENLITCFNNLINGYIQNTTFLEDLKQYGYTRGHKNRGV